MTYGALQVMSADHKVLPERLGAALRKRTPSAKHLANRIDCDPRTAERIRKGEHWPTARHWWAITSEFGDDIIEAVFHPEQAAARLEREVADLEAKLAAKRAELVEGADPGAPQARHPLQDRAAGMRALAAPDPDND